MIEVVELGWSFVNVFALVGANGVVVVDSHYEDHEDRIVRRLERAGVDADRVTLVLLTHGHADHAGSARALADRLGVPVAVGAGDVPKLASGRMRDIPYTGARGRMASVIIHKRFDPFTADLEVADTLDLGAYGLPGAVARVLDGHTPGSLVVTLPDRQVLVGDLVRTHLLRHHAATLHFVQEDAAAAHAALDGLVAEGFTTFWPSHGGTLEVESLGRWLDGRRHRDEQRIARHLD